MDQFFELLQVLSRWLHVVFGIIWIGYLYFFNFVNAQFVATLDPETKKKVVPELLPRALFWFRWGAVWTWITGIFMLEYIYYRGKAIVADPATISSATWVMVAVTFLAFYLYDYLAKSFGKDAKKFGVIAFVVLAGIIYLYSSYGMFSYRGMIMHTGVMFGTIMAVNVWFRIWPSQQKIITAVKNGEAPDASLVALAGQRSRHNTYMSVPLLFSMLAAHTTYFAGGNLGLTEATAWIGWLVIILFGWHVVFQFYKKSGKVKGF
ncbi:MAG: urate hydroxylase PuuD [Bacteroidetes bacterium]|nr:urate hydroxylase PuuD [Bacteroidota bacterium]